MSSDATKLETVIVADESVVLPKSVIESDGLIAVGPSFLKYASGLLPESTGGLLGRSTDRLVEPFTVLVTVSFTETDCVPDATSMTPEKVWLPLSAAVNV